MLIDGAIAGTAIAPPIVAALYALWLRIAMPSRASAMRAGVPGQPSVRPKNRIVRSHAMPAQAASYCVIGSRRGPCAVSLANA